MNQKANRRAVGAVKSCGDELERGLVVVGERCLDPLVSTPRARTSPFLLAPHLGVNLMTPLSAAQ